MSAERMGAYADWLVANKGKQGTPEFDTVANAYRALRAQPAEPPAGTVQMPATDEMGNPIVMPPPAAPARVTPPSAAYTAARDVLAKDPSANPWGPGANFADSATFGAAPYITAAVETPFRYAGNKLLGDGSRSIGDTFLRSRDIAQAQRDAFRERNPGTALGTGVAGGLIGGTAVAQKGLTFAGRQAEAAAARQAAALTSGSTAAEAAQIGRVAMVPQMATNAADAAIQSGLQGFIESNGDLSRAGHDASIAATVGAVLTPLLRGAGWVRQQFRGGGASDNLPPQMVPNTGIFGGPERNMAPSRQAYNDAQVDMRSSASDPFAAAGRISANAKDFAANGDPVPASGILSQDPGLIMREKADRATGPIDARRQFAEQQVDTARAAQDRVAGVTPEGADPNALRMRAEGLTQEATAPGQAEQAWLQGGLDQQAAAGARQTEPIVPLIDQRVPASEAIHGQVRGAYNDMATERTRLWSEKTIAPDNPMIPTQALSEQAARVRAANEGLPPGVREPTTPNSVAARVEALSPQMEAQPSSILDASGNPVMRDVNVGGPGELPAQDLVRMRRDLSMERDRLRLAGTGEKPSPGALTAADVYMGLRNAVDARLADTPGVGERFNAARSFETNEFNPQWRAGPQDPASQLTQKFKNADRVRDPNAPRGANDAGYAPPSETAGRFLAPNSPESGAAFARTMDVTASPQTMAQSGRTYVLGNIAERAVRNGQIDAQALIQARRDWGGAIDALPGLRQEIDDMVAQATNRQGNVTQLTQSLEQARTATKAAGDDVGDSALRFIVGKNPKAGVGELLDSNVSVDAIRDLKNRIGPNEAAQQSLKANMAEHFADKVRTVNQGALNEEGKIGLKAFDTTFRKYEATMAEVFTPEEMNSLRRVHKMLTFEANQVAGKTTAGSDSAANLSDRARLKGNIDTAESAAKLVMSFFQTSRYAGFARKLLGEVPTTEAAARDVVARAWFDPKLASALLTGMPEFVKNGAAAFGKTAGTIGRGVEAGLSSADSRNSLDSKTKAMSR